MPQPNALPLVDSHQLAQAVINNRKAIAAEISNQAKKQTDDPLRQAQLVKSFDEVAGELQKATRGDRVMTTPRHPMASVLQSFIAQKAAQSPDDNVEIIEDAPAVKFSDDDLLHWIGTGFVAVFEGQNKFPWKTAPDDPDPLKNNSRQLRIAVFGDWGTAAYGAPVIADSIRNDPDGFDMVLHLGDTYYSGQPEEIQRQLVDAFPYRTDALNRCLNGNHDMYSGGKAYHDAIQGGKFQQRESHFYVQNQDWVLVGLDTAYVDHDMPDEEVAWFSRIMAQAGERKVVLFSHHQPFSLLDQQGPNLVQKLEKFLNDRRIFAWYWGHEHRCVLYDQHPKWGLFGRCVGHGGFPYYRDILGPVADKPTWKVLRANDDSPGGAILDGPNQYVKDSPEAYGPHGYMSLMFFEGQMREFVHEADGTTIQTKSLTAAAAGAGGPVT
jgi:Calcineurin-like phosphoesterase